MCLMMTFHFSQYMVIKAQHNKAAKAGGFAAACLGR